MTQICGFDGRGCDNCLQQSDIDPKFARSGKTNKKTMVEEEGFVDS
jgi:hypothetical protein